MVTISHLVRKYVSENPFISEAMIRGILSHPGLAEELLPNFEEELGKKIKLPAIIMALRRYEDEIKDKFKAVAKAKVTSQLTIKSGLCVFAVRKSQTLFKELDSISKLVDRQKDTLNVSHGNYDVSIIVDDKYKEKIKTILKKEKVLKHESGLVSISITFSKEYFSTPGVIFLVVRNFAWHDINITELISANSELAIITKKQDAARAYKVLEEVMQ